MTYEGVFMHEPEVTAMPPDHFLSNSESMVSRIVAIGSTSVLREYRDADYADLYKAYAEYFAMPPARTFTADTHDLKDKYIGYTLLRMSRVGSYAKYVAVLVPRRIDGIKYEGRVAAVMTQGSADLVAAVTNEDGFLEITKLLCRRDQIYSACSKAYAQGVYDARTGGEIAKDGAIKDGGVKIDPNTFKSVAELTP